MQPCGKQVEWYISQLALNLKDDYSYSRKSQLETLRHHFSLYPYHQWAENIKFRTKTAIPLAGTSSRKRHNHFLPRNYIFKFYLLFDQC